VSERRAWDVPVDEIKTDTLKAALVEASGIITHAATALGVSRQHVTKLMRRYDLVEFAAKLRVESGAMNPSSGARPGAALGRPRGS